MPERSPLAPESFPDLPAVAGVALSAIASGIRYKGRTDLMLAVVAPGATVAGVFTRSCMASAPVDWCRAGLKGGRARAVVVNSGNSNAFTGKRGKDAVRKTAQAAAKLVGCRPSEVFIASTGVIGEPPPADKIIQALPGLKQSAAAGNWLAAAQAIMTTDTFPKGATRTATIGGKKATLNGFAKGSGMIAPDMATMLAFLFTDAAIPPRVLQALVSDANDRTFNSITVDGDTSTSDTVLLVATGKAANKKVARASDPALRDFRAKLEDLMRDLAQQIVRDGEGAQKFVTVTVTGAKSDSSARKIALAIGNSPLVKTAVAGEDANWGRIVMAVGKSGEKANRDKVRIKIGGVLVAKNGGVVSGYDEAPVAAHMKTRDIAIEVDVGVGKGRATIWTCDLTHEYIAINADYRS
jgi:glutamate N-acetyltransferase/amino-acid N-acetyltransferase